MPDKPKKYPGDKPILPLNFAKLLLNYKALQHATEEASLKASEAEAARQQAYKLEVSLREKIIDLWKGNRKDQTMTCELFRLPDGQIVRIQNTLIWFEPTTNLQ